MFGLDDVNEERKQPITTEEKLEPDHFGTYYFTNVKTNHPL